MKIFYAEITHVFLTISQMYDRKACVSTLSELHSFLLDALQ